MKNKKSEIAMIVILTVISVLFIAPIIIVFMNSFKSKLYINSTPFALPNADSFVKMANYGEGLIKTGFIQAFFITLFITVASVVLIVLLTSMTAWYLVRVKSHFTKVLYYLFAFAMIVPFQMVMFTLSNVADRLKLNTPWTIPIVYLGFGAGLAVFMFVGFVKSMPLEIEEAAAIDGCGPIRTFFLIVLPMLKPTMISVGVLEIMWVWNDYLLPYLVLDINKYRTIPIHIQYLKGSYGTVDMGATMALIALSIIPVIIFYLACQKYIIKGVAAGAVCGAGVVSELAFLEVKGTLVIGITDFEPMDYKDADGSWIGFDADMAKAFAESLGVTAEFVEIDWDNKILELDSKTIDCVWNGMTLTAEVTSTMECSNAYCNNAQVVIVPADKASEYQTVESVKDLTFAAEAGSAGEAELTALGYTVTPVKAQSDALMEVAAGTSDAAVIDSLMAAAMVGEGTGYASLTYTCGLNSEEYGVGFRKGSDLAQKLNDFFKASYADGSMMQIAETYGVQAAIIEQK